MRNNKLPSYRIFNLITLVIDNFNLKEMTKYLCSISGVFKSGYYNYKSNLSSKNHIGKRDLKSKELILRAFNFRGYSKGSRSIKMILQNKFNIVFSRKKSKE